MKTLCGGWVAPSKDMEAEERKMLPETNSCHSACSPVNIPTELPHAVTALFHILNFIFFMANPKLLRFDLASWVMTPCCLAGGCHSPEGACCLCSRYTCKQAAFCFSNDGCNDFFLKPVPTDQTTQCPNP